MADIITNATNNIAIIDDVDKVAVQAENSICNPEQEKAESGAERAWVQKTWHDVGSDDHAVVHMKACEAEGRAPVPEMVENARKFLADAIENGVVYAAPADGMPPTAYYSKVQFSEEHGKPSFLLATNDFQVNKPKSDKPKHELVHVRIA